MSVEFTDNRVAVKAAIDTAIDAFLREAGGELVAQTVRNSNTGKVNGGQTKANWKYVVSGDTVTIGNSLENAIWEECGTGEYALEKKGRKGGWYIPIGNGNNEISQAVVDAYNMKVVYGKTGKAFAYTTGKKPTRAFFKAYTAKKSAIENRAAELLKSKLK